jgi:glycerol-1-phosphate dehydrogenase [NAD(P)+]
MKPSDLLGKSFDCECGRRHTVPTEHLYYSSSAVDRLPEVARQYVARPDYLIIADERTYEIAGHLVEEALKNDGATVKCFIVPDREGESPITDDETRDFILGQAPSAELYIASGSGVINDLTKWIAFERKKPFLTVATAASMNGYASSNVSATINGLKVLFQAQACKGVFAIPDVIENAPFDLTASGLGDVIAKPVSSADWKLNQYLFDEYYCQFSVDLLKDLESVYLEQPDKIKKRDGEAIQALFEALFYSSVAMTITGTSAPASGGEHLFSHTLDMISTLEGNQHDFHGRQVGLGSILSAALYEKILTIEAPEFKKLPSEVDKVFWGPLTSIVQGKYQKKIPKSELAARKLSRSENWDSLRVILKQNLLPAQKIKNCLKQAGAAHRINDIRLKDNRLKTEKLLQIWKNANQMRERFNILDLAIMVGIMPGQAEDVVNEWVKD